MKDYKRIILLIACLLIASINFNLILRPEKLATGGTQAIGLVLGHVLNIKVSNIILIINVVMLLLSIVLLNKETTSSILISSLVYPIFIKVTSYISISSITNINIIILSIISGIISGITNGFILKSNYSTGGINVAVLVLKKYFNIEEWISMFIINSVIILFGSLCFGIDKLVYSILVIFVSSIVIKIIIKKTNKV